jgi:hypothetical protein
LLEENKIKLMNNSITIGLPIDVIAKSLEVSVLQNSRMAKIWFFRVFSDFLELGFIEF